MSSAPTGVVVCAAACLLLAGCGGGSTASDDEPDSSDTPASASDGFEPPAGKVLFDLDVARADRHAAVDAYAAWQRAATTSLRDRELNDATRRGASDGTVRTVERSLDTVQDGDYTVPKRMVGRLESVRATPRAAMLGACLWSPSFDYRDRETGRRAVREPPRWMGVEVRMTRLPGQDGRWIVAGLSTRDDCEGKRP